MEWTEDLHKTIKTYKPIWNNSYFKWVDERIHYSNIFISSYPSKISWKYEELLGNSKTQVFYFSISFFIHNIPTSNFFMFKFLLAIASKSQIDTLLPAVFAILSKIRSKILFKFYSFYITKNNIDFVIKMWYFFT